MLSQIIDAISSIDFYDLSPYYQMTQTLWIKAMPTPADNLRYFSLNGMPVREGLHYCLFMNNIPSYLKMDYPQFIAQLPFHTQPQQMALLKKSSERNWHALMTVSRFYPSSLPALIGAIYRLPPLDREKILTQVNDHNQTALTLTLLYQPKSIHFWIDAVLHFRDLSLIKGHPKVLSCVAKHYPSALNNLLPMISQLDYQEQCVFFNGLTPIAFAQRCIKNVPREDTQHVRQLFGHAETQFFLKKLKSKVEDLDKRVGILESYDAQEAKEAMNTLYQTLQNSYDRYLLSHSIPTSSQEVKPSAPPAYAYEQPQASHMTLQDLKETWASAIKEAEPILSKHRGSKESLFRASMVGLSFLSFGAPIWYSLSKHGSFFPPSPKTDSMHITHQVEKAFETELHFKTL